MVTKNLLKMRRFFFGCPYERKNENKGKKEN
jgi:hypothetical protein